MQIRKIFTQIEDIHSEAGRDADTPLRKVARGGRGQEPPSPGSPTGRIFRT